MNHTHIFNLKVQKIEQICLFELTWGKGQRLTTQINYPTVLTRLYQDWQRAYLSFYDSEQMRGKMVSGGVAAVTLDWHAELVNAETKLMYEFHRWLRSAELYEIRAAIAKSCQEQVTNPETQPVQLFLTCAPIELDRFPWEAWEIDTEFATGQTLQIIRASLNIKDATFAGHKKQPRRRTRILAIMGDDTGLNFEAEREAVSLLFPGVEFVGWQPGKTPSQVIQEISDAIADPQGWDILFFAGHSNETQMTGGELGIAPGVSIFISEIATQLSVAKERGLQVAIFNSCSGLSIADALINLGFGQVVVMREPIHNRVAQEFLVRFLQALANKNDVYESVTEARQHLRMEKSHTYPSSYLVPSLFCHPGATLYRIPTVGWKQRLKQSIPNQIEAIALATTLILSLAPPVQDMLLDGRMFTQAVYRNLTAQIPTEEAPPVALVEIDTESLYRAKLPNSQLHPMNRSYIAKLVDGTRKLNASVVGLDFLFDTPQLDPPSADKDLGTAVRRAVDQNMWLVFGALLEPTREVGTNEALGINKWNWTLQGYVDADPYRVELPSDTRDCRQACPISYLMSLVQTAKDEITQLPKPQTNRTTNLRADLLDAIAQKNPKGNLAALFPVRSPFGLQPLIDFSLPPDRVYTKIPAWKLIENPNLNSFPLISQQVVLIAAGNDERLGIAPDQADRSSAPSAMNYWTHQSWFTGGESLAYMTHHFLTRHIIIPIPDIWAIVVAITLSKITGILLKRQFCLSPKLRLQILTCSLGGAIIYGIFVAQFYISAGVLLPWFLPSSVFLAYVISATRKQNHA